MVAYHASHEQFAPSRLLRLAEAAELAGFDAIHSSDHFHPWSVRQGESGFAFSWVASVLQATKLPVSMVCAPGQRYHTAIVAQAIATLAEMYPGRYSVELGSGEALNEMITGTAWPSKQIRNERLKESADVIRKLLNGQQVTFHGHINVKNAKLYTLPATRPPLFCAAISEQTAAWAGEWADGLLTTAGDLQEVIKKREQFEMGGGKGKPVRLQFSFSYDHDREAAIDGAYDQWRTNIIGTDKLDDLSTPQQFDIVAEKITREEISEKVPIYTNIEAVIDHVQKYLNNGFQMVTLHNVNKNQEQFVEDFGKVYKKI
ncbi:TIGR03885 family FMN-dependent LLM class oxidoreductase [Flavitalea sp.]|nr:TIGR03885 family FMN-dependent LLM class oxidoreductase [Flavitalea sp.]